MAINTSPEPVTNIAASTAGDVSVVGVSALAASFPLIAAGVAGVLLLATAIIFWFALSRVKKGWRAIRRWMQRDPQAT